MGHAPRHGRHRKRREALPKWTAFQVATLVAVTIAVSAWITRPTPSVGDTALGGTAVTAGARPATTPTRADTTKSPSAAPRRIRHDPPSTATDTPDTRRTAPASTPGQARMAAAHHSATPTAAAVRARTAVGPLDLDANDLAKCPPTAVACVDIKRHITWLQAKGRVSFGPVKMMPGRGEHATPTGSFKVTYKDKDHVSNIYWYKMPYSVFFATGGIAFHEGSLVRSSHGCVHLSMANAAHYFGVLEPGDQVVVF